MRTCKLLIIGTTCMPVAIIRDEDEKQNDEAIVSRVILYTYSNGSVDNITNCRLISLSSSLCKIVEKVLFKYSCMLNKKNVDIEFNSHN